MSLYQGQQAVTQIRHPEARPRPLEPGEPRRATATDVGLAGYRHILSAEVGYSRLRFADILRGPRGFYNRADHRSEPLGHLRMTVIGRFLPPSVFFAISVC